MKAVLFGSNVARPGGQRYVTESSQRSRYKKRRGRAINPRHSVLSHVTVTALLYSTSSILTVPLSVQLYAKYQCIKIVCNFIRQTINTK